MIDNDTLSQVLDATERRNQQRRQFLRTAGGASLAIGASALLAACGGSGSSSATPTPSPSPTPTSTSTSAQDDATVLNFAINFEYLQAQFYAYATTGTGIAASLLTGVGPQGAVTGARQVNFADPLLGQYAREIAADDLAHVAFLRSALGDAAVAQPTIDLSADPGSPFTKGARAAGIIGPTAIFDPYASDENFLLAAFLFADVAVTAYKGAAILLNNLILIDALGGLLSTKAYHAGLIRTVLYTKGVATPSLRTQAGQISDARDAVDGPTDDDQGIVGTATTSNIVPADTNGIVFTRTAGQVLNVLYQTNAATVGGGFFPAGFNGTIKMSAAS
jgi:hypothetical protein